MARYRWMFIFIVVDAVLVNMALLLALWLRFDGNIPAQYYASYRSTALLFTLVWLISFYAFGLYARMWQYASVNDLLSIVGAVTAGVFVNISLAYFYMEGGKFPLPRTVFIIAWLLNVVLIGGFRFSWRLFLKRGIHFGRLRAGRPVLIVGAGEAGAAVARELNNQNNHHHVPVGFVDDDPAKQKMQLFGLPVLGTREDIPRLVDRYAIEEIIIAMPSVPGRVIREIVEICRPTGAKLRILPGIYELIDGKVTVSQIRNVEVEDLLGREPVKVNLEEIAGYLEDRIVLVTGAGGSIGSELCRQIAQFNPRKLILLGHGENSIFEIHRELSQGYPELELAPAIVDVRDAASVNRLFVVHRPHVVFHAAAHKHVPLMEENAFEALKNNVWGTFNVARAAHDYNVRTFVLISTDKAVNPVSIMGATKRVAEMVVQEMALKSKTCFAAVRFGNVLGSRGSVVPIFKKQIASGGPVTVTHPEMTRYFMTIPEAVQLIIQAGAMARGGEIFVLDMGEPVKIVELAETMIRLSGFEPGEDIEIVFTGVRPGEKLSEELLTSAEKVNSTRHERIFIARPEPVDSAKLNHFLSVLGNAGWLSEEEAVALLQGLIPNFRKEKWNKVAQVG
ncbi:FlaA1/EpsC-like NDP-sugar epimerase [Desulfofundulus luciae]|uniref:FlaA1/EpsC-like NDP-sugar epimerase n=2 Tax=Desulfofundulus luciae TaxID=74702 RepID=A0ABU0B046_9FIRM|nr:FlaA1/EpsC-like NDP-sugar epimerase [Desulfofundulus luciae]